MRILPLARDSAGKPFGVPSIAAMWKVFRHTGGRPTLMTDEEGGPLYVPIDATMDDLIDAGCTWGSYYLEAVDSKKKPVRVRRAVVDIAAPESVQAPPTAATPRASAAAAAAPAPDDTRGYTRVIEAMARQTVDVLSRFADQQARFVETTSRLCSLVESLALRTPQANVRETIQTVQAIRNAAPELAPPTIAVQTPPETSPEKIILDGLGSMVSGVFRSPAAQIAVAKKLGFTAEEIALMTELAKNQAQGAAMPFAPPSQAQARAPSSGASSSSAPPPWPPELEPILAQLTPDERVEAIDYLTDSLMTPAHIEQICAELRQYATLAEKVAHTRAFLSLARKMVGRAG